MSWSITFPESTWNQVQSHLFPGDHDEHGGVLEVGTAMRGGEPRLLVRRFIPARDGVDYVPGTRGYRRLEPSFVRDRILECRRTGLGYLAIHNHGGAGRAAFSSDDLASHERGYPALRDIGRGVPVGALVLTRDAVAGDIWEPGGGRGALSRATVVGRRITHLYPEPMPGAAGPGIRFDRQTRIFGDAGQRILADLRVGIIGCGGVGMLLVEYLSRLGVGHILVIDPDRVDMSNLPRLAGARESDAGWFARTRWPLPLRKWGRSRARQKVDVARRIAIEANPQVVYTGIVGNVLDPDSAARFTDVDYLFLAADTAQARLLFNAIVHQYLVPGVQLGSKVLVDKATGSILDVHSIVRRVTPDAGCLWCNELISSQALAEESLSEDQLRGQRYVDDPEVVAPSVITLNAVAAAHAANDFLFAVTGIVRADAPVDYLRLRPLERDTRWDRPRRDDTCSESGSGDSSRLARGDALPLPTRVRS